MGSSRNTGRGIGPQPIFQNTQLRKDLEVLQDCHDGSLDTRHWYVSVCVCVCQSV